MICIYCDNKNSAISVDHIVPEAFGNKKYITQKGQVCDKCNNKFSKFEAIALANSMFVVVRAILGVPSKKGKNAKGKVGEFTIEGDENFKRNVITLQGPKENFKKDPQTNTGKVIIPHFNKSEVATSKLLLKMAFSSIFTSRRDLFIKYDFSEAKDFILSKNNIDWPFTLSSFEPSKFTSIPKYGDKYNLNRIKCFLTYCELNDKTFLFMFKFGKISMVTNLLNRSLNWINEYLKNDQSTRLYPDHYNRKPPNWPKLAQIVMTSPKYFSIVFTLLF